MLDLRAEIREGLEKATLIRDDKHNASDSTAGIEDNLSEIACYLRLITLIQVAAFEASLRSDHMAAIEIVRNNRN